MNLLLIVIRPKTVRFAGRNDLPRHVSHGMLTMYADDCQFLDSDSPDCLSSLKQRVESTLETALNWFTQNRLKINPCKHGHYPHGRYSSSMV